MFGRRPALLLGWVCVAALAGGCSSAPGDAQDGADTGADRGAGSEVEAVARGESFFDTHCAACHGPQGTGTTSGPPLVHEIYEPGHHPDESFQRAVAEGVPQHHWDFGAMPALSGLDRDAVSDIIDYVRELQRDAGIIE